uniref:DUF1145 domain-containing protein n=1 Tax=Methanosphaera cuniculi TaxID=1077256 RepID=UPI001C5EA43F
MNFLHHILCCHVLLSLLLLGFYRLLLFPNVQDFSGKYCLLLNMFHCYIFLLHSFQLLLLYDLIQRDYL